MATPQSLRDRADKVEAAVAAKEELDSAVSAERAARKKFERTVREAIANGIAVTDLCLTLGIHRTVVYKHGLHRPRADS
ncbi:MAG: hypothetical protein OXF99_04860 [bacterium]|nr:hypothetical protein [bacterium]